MSSFTGFLLLFSVVLLVVQGSLIMSIPTNMTAFTNMDSQLGIPPCTCNNGKVYFPSVSGDNFAIVEVDPVAQITTTYPTTTYQDLEASMKITGPVYILCTNNTIYFSWTIYEKGDNGQILNISNGLYEALSLNSISISE